MELDELKKSWNALNEQLQKEPIADEQQITELIAGYKANTRKSLGRLVVIQRFSIGMGAVGLAALLLIWLLLPTFGLNEQLQGKIVALLGFIAISILIGMWWDWKTYRWNKDTRIDEMGVAERFSLNVNRKELIRGALLHDYFLYDWHEKNAGHRFHGFIHAGRALQNAKNDFELTRREENIISRHMFPLNIVPPMCKEAWLVCLADKICASKETIVRRIHIRRYKK